MQHHAADEAAPLVVDADGPTYYDATPAPPRRRLRRRVRVVAAAACLCGGAIAHRSQHPTALNALSTTTEVLKAEPLDWSLGLLARLLVLLAVYLLVVEVRLPAWMTGEEPTYVKVDEEDEEAPPTMVEVATYVFIYMAAAIGIVYLNAYILTQWPWAATLTMLQMVFCSLAARGCVLVGLAEPDKVGMTWAVYGKVIVPLSALYCIYLYGSNAVYDYLQVGYIQLLKPGQMVGVYVLLVLCGKERVAPRPFLNMVIITGGVLVATLAGAEISGWSTWGFALMMVSNACYSLYLVGQQLALSTALSDKAAKMDAVTNIYFLGPPTACFLALTALCSEWTNPTFTLQVSWWVLLCDGALAFSLNLIQITILKRLSALTYMFAGYAKLVVTAAISVLFYDEPVDGLEIFGFGVLLLGQGIWSLRKLRARGALPERDAGLRIKLGMVFGLAAVVLVLSLSVSGCVALPCQAPVGDDDASNSTNSSLL